MLLDKLNFKEEINTKIKEINWERKVVLKYSEIEDTLKEAKKETIVVVSGSKEYIENVNKSINKYIEKNKKQKFKIINCYEVSGFNKNMKEILDMHNKILNTSGERNIEEVFDGYSKKEESRAENE